MKLGSPVADNVCTAQASRGFSTIKAQVLLVIHSEYLSKRNYIKSNEKSTHKLYLGTSTVRGVEGL